MNQRIFAEDPEEAAKLFGMYLRCAGRLKCYAEESKPCKIEVRSTDFEAHFNAWFETRPIDECTHGTVVILECCFVKKVLFYRLKKSCNFVYAVTHHLP